MKTLSWTLWNFRSIILILAAPLLLLPLPLVIGTKVSSHRHGDQGMTKRSVDQSGRTTRLG